jgi:hypothetical protein
LAPSVALAFPGSVAAHCFSEDFLGTPTHEHGIAAHVHADGRTHHHADGGTHKKSGSEDKGHAANCCGLFSVVAIPGTVILILGSANPAPIDFPALEDVSCGRGPERLIRPPIS